MFNVRYVRKENVLRNRVFYKMLNDIEIIERNKNWNIFN